ncbi:hypothetical protein HK147_05840 [Streptococcus agalactiae]|nr:hypothetical protein [Streptococcus agalactiae]
MNHDMLLRMLRATIPRDKNTIESFLRYQADHFDEDWESLLSHFLDDRGQRTPPIQFVQFETDISAFVKASPYESVHDLLRYTRAFGQEGLQKLTKLTQEEENLVIEVALFNLATRFQLLDNQNSYQSISLSSLLEKGKTANLVNVYRVANHAVRMKTFSSSFCARTSILKRFLFKSMICLASFSK